ncbi:MAG: hypothetical protein QM759_16260 [Terricaulis sp.]
MQLRNFAGASALLALAACATGGDHGRGPETIRALLSADVMMFVSFDTNGDLSTSGDELTAGIDREWQRADANHDGQLQPIEFQNWANTVLGGQQMGPYRLDFDRNVDNVITREEFEHEIRARFADYDADENGAISRNEFVRVVGQARPVHRSNPMQPQPGNGG